MAKRPQDNKSNRREK